MTFSLSLVAAEGVAVIAIVAGGVGLLLTVLLLLALICAFCCCCYLCRPKSVPVDQCDLISADWAGVE